MLEAAGARAAVVVVLDYLSPAFLSPYGATWLETPTFNRLAAHGFTFDFAWSIATDLPTVYAGYWRGFRFHSSIPAGPVPSPGQTLADHVHALGVKTLLMSDEPELMQFASAGRFQERQLWSIPPPDEPACTPEETYLAQLFAAAWDTLRQQYAAGEPLLAWIHFRALGTTWDAPYDLRRQLSDPEDPPPPDWLMPPVGDWPQRVDPDQVWGLRCAYGAQVIALDAALGAFVAAMEQLEPRRPLLLIITSPRGYPLADHGHVGPNPPSLYSESLHVPLLFRLSDDRFRLGRSFWLAQPSDLFATLLAWWNGPLSQSEQGPSNLLPIMETDRWYGGPDVISRGMTEWSVRSGKWFLRKPSDEASQLFVKPDDRYDVNDVARRCPEVVVQLEATLHKVVDAYRTLPPR